ncbi:hypothetical protein EDC04DRAFT_2519635, partial [Pisolithus marmoratus]
ASRHITIAPYDPPLTMHVVIRYFDSEGTGSDIWEATAVTNFVQGVTLGMHEEPSYKGLNLIESEVRRRAFWLLFG